jgi:hypothetical protein
MIKEFRDFILRGNVVALAVAVIIAAIVFFLVVKPLNMLMARTGAKTSRPRMRPPRTSCSSPRSATFSVTAPMLTSPYLRLRGRRTVPPTVSRAREASEREAAAASLASSSARCRLAKP